MYSCAKIAYSWRPPKCENRYYTEIELVPYRGKEKA